MRTRKPLSPPTHLSTTHMAQEEEEAAAAVEEEEQVMSEVHLGCPPLQSGAHISRFTFPLPTKGGGYSHRLQGVASSSRMLDIDNDGDLALIRKSSFSSVHYQDQCSDQLYIKDTSSEILRLDEDGDLVLTRQASNYYGCPNRGLIIRHNVTSSLPSVGLQVWMAALVLTDFVLYKSFTYADFNDVTAIELGAGTGLVGIALAPVARRVFLTDKGAEVLDNCATNVHVNLSLLDIHDSCLRVRELDWKDLWPPKVVSCDIPSQQRPRYDWSSPEIEEAEESTVLLAADVIYSDELTDCFFGILQGLMSQGPEKVLYLSLEKRYNFSLDDLDVVANGYAHFRSFLKDEDDAMLDDTLQPCFLGKQIDLNEVPQYIREYERGTNVELWKITYCSKKPSSSSVSS